MIKTPSAGYSFIARLEILSKPGMFGKVASAIGQAGGDLGAIDIIGTKKDTIIRDVVVSVADIHMGQQVVDHLKKVRGVQVLNVADRTFMDHQGGKIEIKNKIPCSNRDDLSRTYTPGVARVCLSI